MRRLLPLLLLFPLVVVADTILKDEGTRLGPISTIDCRGPGVTCSRSGSTGTVTVSGGAADPFSMDFLADESVPIRATTRPMWNTSTWVTTNWGTLSFNGATAPAAALPDSYRDGRVWGRFFQNTNNPVGISQNGTQDDWRAETDLALSTRLFWGATHGSTGGRFAFGFASANPTGTDTPTVTGAWFRFTEDTTTTTGDTDFKCCVGDGTGAASCSPSGVVRSLNTIYALRVVKASGVAAFYINGMRVCEMTSGLPASGAVRAYMLAQHPGSGAGYLFYSRGIYGETR